MSDPSDRFREELPCGCEWHAGSWTSCVDHRDAHALLLKYVIRLPSDFTPFGGRPRDGFDCSCGCRYFVPLEGPLGADWGVCVCRDGPRAGLLTFEHQGCLHFKSVDLP